MYEIELKAHVDDKAAVINKLNEFAQFLESVKKDDTYWGIFKETENGLQKIQARIRKEINLTNPSKSKIYLTYKRKESRFDNNGKVYEVNDEKESELSDAVALESLFEDLGMKIVLTKQKAAIGYQFGEAHIELCTVPPLGDFLEIEIISEQNDEKTVFEKRKKLLEVLKLCEISEEKIENRYYSEMLKEVSNQN